MYLLDVKFLESSVNSAPKTYTYKSRELVRVGDLVVVEVTGKAKLVIVEDCYAYLGNNPRELELKTYKWIRGTVDDRAWRDQEQLKKSYKELKDRFEEESEAYIQSHAMRNLIGNNPELMEMYNRLERMERMMKGE